MSRQMMIVPIAENNHVYGLEFDHFSGKYILKSIPVNDASTFLGFCKTHEQSFSFESAGMINYECELRMQVFRTICRHLFFVKHELDSSKNFLDFVRRDFNEEFEKLIKLHPLLETPKFIIIDFLFNQLYGIPRIGLKQLKLDHEYTYKHWYDPIGQNLKVGFPPEFVATSILCHTILPVVLSGPALFDEFTRNEDGTPDFDDMYYVNIFPNKGKTTIHLVARVERSNELKALSESLRDGNSRNLRIKKWLFNCGQHWYLKPCFWEAQSDTFKKSASQALSRPRG